MDLTSRPLLQWKCPFIPLTSGDVSAGGGSLKKGDQLSKPSAFLLPMDPEPACTPAQNPEH